MTSDKIRIGKIVACHGIRGDVKVRPAADDPAWVGTVKTLILKHPKTGEQQKVKVQLAKRQGPFVLVHFEEFPSRTAVEPLLGATLFALMSDLPEPDEGEYWADDLIGLTVVDAQTGRSRGMVKDLLSSGGSDFLEIQLEGSTQTVVIPLVEHFFPNVSLENKTISIDLLSDFLAMSNTPVTPDRLEQ